MPIKKPHKISFALTVQIAFYRRISKVAHLQSPNATIQKLKTVKGFPTQTYLESNKDPFALPLPPLVSASVFRTSLSCSMQRICLRNQSLLLRIVRLW